MVFGWVWGVAFSVGVTLDRGVRRSHMHTGSEARTHRICLEGRPFAINGYPLFYVIRTV